MHIQGVGPRKFRGSPTSLHRSGSRKGASKHARSQQTAQSGVLTPPGPAARACPIAPANWCFEPAALFKPICAKPYVRPPGTTHCDGLRRKPRNWFLATIAGGVLTVPHTSMRLLTTIEPRSRHPSNQPLNIGQGRTLQYEGTGRHERVFWKDCREFSTCPSWLAHPNHKTRPGPLTP